MMSVNSSNAPMAGIGIRGSLKKDFPRKCGFDSRSGHLAAWIATVRFQAGIPESPSTDAVSA